MSDRHFNAAEHKSPRNLGAGRTLEDVALKCRHLRGVVPDHLHQKHLRATAQALHQGRPQTRVRTSNDRAAHAVKRSKADCPTSLSAARSGVGATFQGESNSGALPRALVHPSTGTSQKRIAVRRKGLKAFESVRVGAKRGQARQLPTRGEHAGLHRRLVDTDNLGDFLDRLAVIVHEVNDLAVLR